ncbi:hypothetical protein Tco_0100648 [Tanacetum coccineum]
MFDASVPIMEENTLMMNSQTIFMRLKYVISSHVLILRNKMGFPRERIGISRKYVEDMMAKEKDGGVLTQQRGNATHIEMLCSMKPHLGGPLITKYYQRLSYSAYYKRRYHEASDSDQHAEVWVGQNPWHRGVYQRHEEDDPNQPQVENALRRLTRTRKPNPKYVNAAIVETDQKEPDTF